MEITTEHQHRRQRARLIASLLLCPLSLVVAIAAAPRLAWLYGTSSERFLYLVLLCLPLVGAIGIVRFSLLKRLHKSLAVLFYLVVAGALVFFALVYVGCTVAKACF